MGLEVPLRLPAHAPGQRIGLYGGSFDPPHRGHLHVSRMVLARLGLDRLWWLVTPGNPIKERAGRPPLATRLAMSRAIARDPRIVVTDIEDRLGSALSADTVAALQARMPGVRLVWIMGADNLASFHRWNRWREIAGSIPIAVVDRPGWTLSPLASPAAARLAPYRVPEGEAMTLADRAPPAWVFLHGPRSPLSSTALRASAAPY